MEAQIIDFPGVQLVAQVRAEGPRTTLGLELELLELINTIAPATKTRIAPRAQREFNRLFSMAALYGRYNYEWAGCRFLAAEPSILTLTVVRPGLDLRWRLSSIAEMLGRQYETKLIADREVIWDSRSQTLTIRALPKKI